MSKKSVPAWLKQYTTWTGPYAAITEAILVHAREGDHPDILFKGSTMELATALYVEHAKKAGAAGGLYCTRPEVALKMAQSLKLEAGMTVLNPGSGLLALSLAVEQVEPGARVINVENQFWLTQATEAAGYQVRHGDFLDGLGLPEFDAVIANPPWGKMNGHGNIDAEFMAHIVGLAKPGTKVAALLGGEPGYFFEKLKWKYQGLKDRLHVLETQYFQNGAHLPKSIPCTRYLLEVMA